MRSTALLFTLLAGFALGKTTLADKDSKTIQAERIMLTGPDGRPRCTIGYRDIVFLDEDGRIMVKLGLDALGETAQLNLGTLGRNKGSAVVIGANAERAELVLRDGKHRERVQLTASTDRAGLVVLDSSAKPKIQHVIDSN